jgi:hypothetical protein
MGPVAVYLNADGASHGDVIVPYGFFKGKRCKTHDTVVVSPRLEMAKCEDDRSSANIALDAFHVVWRGLLTVRHSRFVL